CKGALVEWLPGSIWSTYPYHRHLKHDFPWEPVAVENEKWIRIRASTCLVHLLRPEEDVCGECTSIAHSKRLSDVMTHSAEAPLHTQHWTLTHAQLLAALQKLSTLQRKINDHQRLTMLLATHDVKRLRELLTVALRKGASPRMLLAQIEKSLAGLYTPRGGFEQRELDVAFLAKSLGGPRLLHALLHSHGLPSASTLRRHAPIIPRLQPCVGQPSTQEVSTNISALFDPHVKAPMLVRSPDPSSNAVAGVAMLVDGVALDERCRYREDGNCVVGLCREHCSGVRTKITSLEDVKNIEAALHPSEVAGSPESTRDPSVHYGKDGTVVAIAPYARTDHYTPVPLLVSASCKTETGEGMVTWLTFVLDAWKNHPFGEQTHGPIWALASDGESSFRRARFLLCMQSRIDPASGLGQRLVSLSGLNLLTGPNGIVGTCDPKHVLKRFATLLRNPKGIQVFNTLLTCHDIYAHLQAFPSMTPDKARQLLDPADKQNVPKAVNLLQTLLKLETEAPTPSTPSTIHRRRMLSFLARTLSYFTLPFISVTMSLSEQVRSLATYSHLLAAMWMRHRTKFTTGALFADSQAIVKNVVLTVARLQLVDPNIPFHIIHEGTDRLEGVFSDVRTQDHSRNFDVLQLSDKLTTGALIQGVFERNPDLDRGHRRLSLKDAMGIDHVNPRSWTGSIRVGDVELAAEWIKGRDDANRVLETYHGPSARVDFETLFRKENCDLLRPEGHYVGSEYQPDDARTEDAETSSMTVTVSESHTAPSTARRSPAHTRSTPALSASGPGAAVSSTGPRSQAEEDEDDGGYDDVPEGVEIDDFFPAQPGNAGVASHSSAALFADDKWLVIEGKKYLKASVVAIILTAKRARKVIMRTLRARGVTLEDLHGSKHDRFNSSDLAGEDLVKCGDIAATLVRVGSIVCLAAVEILEFELEGSDKGRRVTAVEMTALEKPRGASVQVLVQVLKLRRVEDPTDGETTTAWLWNHQYASVTSKTKTGGPGRMQHTLHVPAYMVYPLGPSIVSESHAHSESECPRASRPPSDDSDTVMDNSVAPEPLDEVTWSLSELQLQESLDIAWAALNPESEDIVFNIEQLPTVTESDGLPYSDVRGASLVVSDLPPQLTMEKPAANASVRCYLCSSNETLSLMRNHIGLEPCGWCGREGCVTRLTVSGTSRKTSSSCIYHYSSMSFASATTPTTRQPCTNVPIHCPFCPQISPGQPATIWKYNALNHILIHHADKDGNVPDIPAQLLVDMHVSRKEEQLMQIPEEITDSWRDENQIPDSDGIEEAQEELATAKRDRAQSTVERRQRARMV
ncbi:hypothetical protein K466DRAFT_611332, partial [Polyporus arcularius HHB13444]